MVLDNVTLVCADCLNKNEAREAILYSTKDTIFKEVLFFSDGDINLPKLDYKFIRIPALQNKVDYCYFIMRKLYEYINTEYLLIIQWDGFILNPLAWTDEFLEYDYIGAPWWWYKYRKVGNGGFSLRSKKLMEFVAKSTKIVQIFPEDDIICRQYGEYLEQNGFTFAPEEIAKKFSVGNYIYTNQFGFHRATRHSIYNLMQLGIPENLYKQILLN